MREVFGSGSCVRGQDWGPGLQAEMGGGGSKEGHSLLFYEEPFLAKL